jgi:hypothetical protein
LAGLARLRDSPTGDDDHDHVHDDQHHNDQHHDDVNDYNDDSLTGAGGAERSSVLAVGFSL